MKHSVPTRRNPYQMLEEALKNGWNSVDSLPLPENGEFMVITMSGLIRRARNRNPIARIRKADHYGPARANVIAIESGNYLAAIAWRPAPSKT